MPDNKNTIMKAGVPLNPETGFIRDPYAGSGITLRWGANEEELRTPIVRNSHRGSRLSRYKRL